MQFVPYLNFDGNCRQAFEFYHHLLGGEIVAMIDHAEMDPDGQYTSPDWRDKIMHARLVVGEAVLMGGDTPPGMYSPSSMHVSLQADTVDEAERIFAAFAEDGSIEMPLEQQAWAARFGMVIDKFGTPWMVNCEAGS